MPHPCCSKREKRDGYSAYRHRGHGTRPGAKSVARQHPLKWVRRSVPVIKSAHSDPCSLRSAELVEGWPVCFGMYLIDWPERAANGGSTTSRIGLAQEVHQLGDVEGDAPGLIAVEQASGPRDVWSVPFKVVGVINLLRSPRRAREVPPQLVAAQTYQPAATDNVPDASATLTGRCSRTSISRTPALTLLFVIVVAMVATGLWLFVAGVFFGNETNR
jgi:hypothetical protein